MGLIIRLESKGQHLPLSPPPAQGLGVSLAAEPGAPPRRTSIELRPKDARAEVGLRISGGAIPFKVTVLGADLFLETEPAGRLHGKYWVRLRIDDLTIARNRWRVATLDANGRGQLTLDALPRTITVSPLDDFDPAIRRVVTGDSQVDGLLPDAWLRDPLRQAKRRACLLNLLAVLRATDLFGQPAIGPLLELLHVGTEYLNARVSAELYWLVSEAARQKDGALRQRVFDDFGVHASHRRAIEQVAQRLGEPLPTSLESFRFEGRPSLQIVFGIPPGAATTHLVDIDLDLGNPRQDLLGMIVHVGELFDEGLDHVKLRRKLVKGPAGQFIHYT